MIRVARLCSALRNRRLALSLALVALPLSQGSTAPASPDPPPLKARFLSQAQAAQALTGGEERIYFGRLQLAEMRAKTGLPLEGMTLEAAREQVRASYAASTKDFSAAEQDALERTTRAALDTVRAHAPLYARTPWCFVKVEARIEGGLPHTRGDCIVLSDAFLARASQRYGPAWGGAPPAFRTLLVHEQTHILQRKHPELFERLYTQAFGFRKISVQMPRWLIERNVTNPDGPDVIWAFPTGSGETRQWILPDVVLNRLDHPRMPEDFALVAIDLHRGADDSWSISDSPAPLCGLSSVPDYQRAFPDHEEDFHPNEISASMLSTLLLALPLQNPDHELWEKMRAWSVAALR